MLEQSVVPTHPLLRITGSVLFDGPELGRDLLVMLEMLMRVGLVLSL